MKNETQTLPQTSGTCHEYGDVWRCTYAKGWHVQAVRCIMFYRRKKDAMAWGAEIAKAAREGRLNVAQRQAETAESILRQQAPASFNEAYYAGLNARVGA